MNRNRQPLYSLSTGSLRDIQEAASVTNPNNFPWLCPFSTQPRPTEWSHSLKGYQISTQLPKTYLVLLGLSPLLPFRDYKITHENAILGLLASIN